MGKESANFPTLKELSYGYIGNILRQEPGVQNRQKTRQIEGSEQFGPRQINGREYFLVNGPFAYPLSPDTNMDTILDNIWLITDHVPDPNNQERTIYIMDHQNIYNIEHANEETHP